MIYETLRSDHESITLHTTDEGAITYFEVPRSRTDRLNAVAEALKSRRYMAHMLTGDDRPEGMAVAYGIWPRPDADAQAALSQAFGLPVAWHEEMSEESLQATAA